MADLDMLIYNALDSAVTLDVAGPIFSDMHAEGHTETYDFTIDLLEPLMYFMTRGLRVDNSRLKSESARVEREINSKMEELHKLCGFELNPGSPKQCKEYFYGTLGVRPYTKLSKNSRGEKVQTITCDDKALQRMAKGTQSRRPIREAKLIQEIRGLSKLKGTYLDIQFDEDDRLRCSANPRGTRFGRISTSKTVFDTGMNLQNLPDSFKKFIIADPGRILIEMDKAQAEWVVTAFASGDSNMIRVCEEGRDPHSYTASEMFGISEDIIKMEAKKVGHTTDPDEVARIREEIELDKLLPPGAQPIRNMSMRQAGKKSNHGLNYQEGYRMFALHNEMLENDAKRIVELYHSIYPGLRKWYDWIKEQLARDRRLTNCFNRTYRFMDRWGDDLFKAATAFIPQSTVSDLLNKGILSIYHDTNELMSSLELLIQVHDSILGQYDDLTTYDDCLRFAGVIHRCRDALNPTLEYHSRQFKIGTDLKIGYIWGDMVEVPILDDVHAMADKLKETVDELKRTNRLADGVPGVHQE